MKNLMVQLFSKSNWYKIIITSSISVDKVVQLSASFSACEEAAKRSFRVSRATRDCMLVAVLLSTCQY